MFNIRYASIRNLDISNGQGIGIALFVQGCHFHCNNCFNKDTWDFNGGKEWTNDIKNEFIKLIDKPYISRVSILGGEPLANENVEDVLKLILEIKNKYPNKAIWLYTGYEVENLFLNTTCCEYLLGEKTMEEVINITSTNLIKQMLVAQCDVVIDGKYIDELRDLTLKFRGSSNQKIIDIKKSLEKNEVVLWSE